MLNNVLTALMHGILLGGIYGAISLGLSLIYGVTKITNFAHGSMLMVSTFAYYGLYMLFGIDPYVGVIIVVPVLYFLGNRTQKFLVTPLIKKERAEVNNPASLLLVTIGLWYTLDNLFMMIFGSDFRRMNTPAGTNYFTIGNFTTQYARIIAFLGAFLLAGVLWFIINKTELGVRIRAVSQNRTAAALCGTDVYKTYNIAFGIGTASVAFAGALLCQFYFVQPQVGAVFGTKSFMIVVLGGLGSIPGAIMGGLIMGIVESVGAQFITSSSAVMLTFLLFILVLFFRPQGLLGKTKNI